MVRTVKSRKKKIPQKGRVKIFHGLEKRDPLYWIEASTGSWKPLATRAPISFLEVYLNRITGYKTYYANYCYCTGSVQLTKSTTTVA
jgi:hypothetical protein